MSSTNHSPAAEHSCEHPLGNAPASHRAASPRWHTSSELVDYQHATSIMTRHVRLMQAGEMDELIWLLQHPPVYTAGTSAQGQQTPSAHRIVHTSRGGKITYHGPGQRVAYLMLNLRRRKPDVRTYVANLQLWIIRSLASLGIESFTREGRVGVWVNRNPRDGRAMAEKKIAAVGVRVSRWVTSHGISINLDCDLAAYSHIIPCGIADFGVTSVRELGCNATMAELDEALQQHWHGVFD